MPELPVATHDRRTVGGNRRAGPIGKLWCGSVQHSPVTPPPAFAETQLARTIPRLKVGHRRLREAALARPCALAREPRSNVRGNIGPACHLWPDCQCQPIHKRCNALSSSNVRSMRQGIGHGLIEPLCARVDHPRAIRVRPNHIPIAIDQRRRRGAGLNCLDGLLEYPRKLVALRIFCLAK
jgi:hypothetical protein